MTWKPRHIRRCPARLEKLAPPTEAAVDWLREQALALGLRWLLAHGDDGVIWGQVDGECLITSEEAARGTAVARYCPSLRGVTLQQARLFAGPAELLLWRDGDNVLQARLIRDAGEEDEPTWLDAFDEPQLLWGTHPEPDTELPFGFTMWKHGAEGLRHAMPDSATRNPSAPPRLVVRHYLANEPRARVVASRLVDLRTEEER